MEKLIDIWGRRNPEFETRYEDNIIKMFCDYGKGSTGYQESRGKLFGAGYEIYIIAFFIGLYFNQRREMNSDSSKRKGLRYRRFRRYSLNLHSSTHLLHWRNMP